MIFFFSIEIFIFFPSFFDKKKQTIVSGTKSTCVHACMYDLKIFCPLYVYLYIHKSKVFFKDLQTTRKNTTLYM